MKKIVLLILANLFIFSACSNGAMKNYDADEAYEIFEEFKELDIDELEEKLKDTGYERKKVDELYAYLKDVNEEDVFMVVAIEDYVFYFYFEDVSFEDIVDDIEKEIDESTYIYNDWYSSGSLTYVNSKRKCEMDIEFDDGEYEFDVYNDYYDDDYEVEEEDGDKDGPHMCEKNSVQKNAKDLANKTIHEMESILLGESNQSTLSDISVVSIILIVLSFILILTALLTKLLIRGRATLVGIIISNVCLVLALPLIIFGQFGMEFTIIIGVEWLLVTIAVILLSCLGGNSK